MPLPLESRAAFVAAQPALAEAPVPHCWWDLFNDPVLRALETGIDTNIDLRMVALRIEESRARLGLVEAERRPAVSADGSYTRAANSENSPIHQLGASTSGYDTWSLGLRAGGESYRAPRRRCYEANGK